MANNKTSTSREERYEANLNHESREKRPHKIRGETSDCLVRLIQNRAFAKLLLLIFISTAIISKVECQVTQDKINSYENAVCKKSSSTSDTSLCENQGAEVVCVKCRECTKGVPENWMSDRTALDKYNAASVEDKKSGAYLCTNSKLNYALAGIGLILFSIFCL